MAWVDVTGSSGVWEYENTATAANTYPDSADGANSTVSGGIRTYTKPGTSDVTETYLRVRKKGQINKALYSEQFDNAYWSKNQGSVSANAGVAPNGTSTADKYIPNTNTEDQHWIYRSLTMSNNTISVYAKADGYDYISLMFYRTPTTSSGVQFNLATGVVVTSLTATGAIESVGDGWYRCSIFPDASTSAPYVIIQPNNGGTPDTSRHFAVTYAGDGTSGCLIWGAQVSDGLIVTPYIKTTGTASTTIERGEVSKTYYDNQ